MQDKRLRSFDIKDLGFYFAQFGKGEGKRWIEEVDPVRWPESVASSPFPFSFFLCAPDFNSLSSISSGSYPDYLGLLHFPRSYPTRSPNFPDQRLRLEKVAEYGLPREGGTALVGNWAKPKISTLLKCCVSLLVLFNHPNFATFYSLPNLFLLTLSLPIKKSSLLLSKKPTNMASLRKLLLLRSKPSSIWKSLSSKKNSFLSSFDSNISQHLLKPSVLGPKPFVHSSNYRNFCSHSNFLVDEESQVPATIDYRSLLQEDEYQKLANSTIHDLLEKLEEYGDSVDIDGYDIDYGNEVLTVKLGELGTYVINKQTPNRQIWMSSPVSGPSRFDWDQDAQAWIYRRTKANLLDILENELAQLCGRVINLS